MTKSYFETCKEVLLGVDADELASLPLGELAGYGSRFEFRRLGKLLIANSQDEHFGIKIPTRRASEAVSRFSNEAALINYVLAASPELAAAVPRFMMLVQVADSHVPAGILTEDVSQGGIQSVSDAVASEAVRRSLYTPYRELGSIDEVISAEACDDSIAFNVGGAERLLDFTPPPINLRFVHAPAEYVDMRCEIEELLPELTITIPRNSVLGTALVK